MFYYRKNDLVKHLENVSASNFVDNNVPNDHGEMIECIKNTTKCTIRYSCQY